VLFLNTAVIVFHEAGVNPLNSLVVVAAGVDNKIEPSVAIKSRESLPNARTILKFMNRSAFLKYLSFDAARWNGPETDPLIVGIKETEEVCGAGHAGLERFPFKDGGHEGRLPIRLNILSIRMF
jgi:hypothetical protein